MKPAIVCDNLTIINTQGIRFIEKVDQTYGTTTTFHLRVTYKGDKMDYRYPNAAERDAQFAALRAVMEGRQADPARLTPLDARKADGSA